LNSGSKRTAQLEAINAELNDFAHIVSHDLKAPLRGLSQLSGWLLNDYEAALDEEGKNFLHLMVQRTQRMHALIDDILHYARIGRTSETEQPVDLKKLLTEIIESLAPPEHVQIIVEATLPHRYRRSNTP
jgi:light-regulated signal transduction histidine kinase (bacteriophytochrome)